MYGKVAESEHDDYGDEHLSGFLSGSELAFQVDVGIWEGAD